MIKHEVSSLGKGSAEKDLIGETYVPTTSVQVVRRVMLKYYVGRVL